MFNYYAVFPLLVICSSVWVYIDASNLCTNKYKGFIGPMGFCVCCLLLWIVFFPFYLVKRKSIINGKAVLKRYLYFSRGNNIFRVLWANLIYLGLNFV
jgi:hypothetical protein